MESYENEISQQVCVDIMDKSPFAYIDKLLPDRVVHHLLSYLDLDDLFELKLVSKNFYSLIESYDIYELSILDENAFVYKSNWYSTTRSIKFNNRLDIRKLSLLKNPPVNYLNLRCLKIWQDDALSIRFRDLNKFKRLVILDVHYVTTTIEDLLQLPELRSLSIAIETFNFSETYDNLVLDTPSLLSLSINLYNGAHPKRCKISHNLIEHFVKIVHTRCVQHFKVNYREDNFEVFGNLKYLDLHFCGDGFIKMIRNAPKLDHLERLRLYRNNRGIDQEIVEKLKVQIGLIRCLNVTLAGVKVEDPKKLNEYYVDYDTDDDRYDKDIDFQLNNYDLLEKDLNFVWQLNTNQLNRLLSLNPQPYDVLRKYNNIQWIQITENVNENQLIYFINGCSNLSRLEVQTPLSKQFYERLPVVCELTYLLIEVEFDFDYETFLNKMPYLISFETNDDLLEIGVNLNNLRSKHLKILSFNSDFERIVMTRENRTWNFEGEEQSEDHSECNNEKSYSDHSECENQLDCFTFSLLFKRVFKSIKDLIGIDFKK